MTNDVSISSVLASDRDRLLGALDLATRGAPQTVVTLERGPRTLLREMADRGLLERAIVMVESEKPPRVAVHPRNGNGDLGITELLEEDHRRLDALARRVSHTVERGEPVDTRALRTFVWGLRRHIRIEEEILFPRFEAATGMRTGGPTFVMRHEHRDIEALLVAIETNAPDTDAVARPAEAEQLERAFSKLGALIEEHNLKEERVLYPTSDRVLPANERAAVVAAIVTF